MAYTTATAVAVARLRADLALITDQQTRDLVAAWADAWNEIAPDLNRVLLDMLISGDKVTRAQMLRSERLRKVLVVIGQQLQSLSETARVRIIGDIRAVIETAGGAQASIIDSQLPPGERDLMGLKEWSTIDQGAVEAIAKRSTEQITSFTRPLSADAMTAVRRELVRGYAAGSSPRATAGRIIARTQGQFNGGLTRALAIARTETLDASRAGAAAGRMLNADVLQGWSWHCELGPRSCPACISMDGEIFSVDEPGPDDHVNGRCTAVPITRSWADLGFSGLDEPASTRLDGAAWFDTLDAGTQQQILGPGKYDAWTSGRYPMSDWGVVKQNPGWRQSLQTTPVPQSGGRTASLAS